MGLLMQKSDWYSLEAEAFLSLNKKLMKSRAYEI